MIASPNTKDDPTLPSSGCASPVTSSSRRTGAGEARRAAMAMSAQWRAEVALTGKER